MIDRLTDFEKAVTENRRILAIIGACLEEEGIRTVLSEPGDTLALQIMDKFEIGYYGGELILTEEEPIISPQAHFSSLQHIRICKVDLADPTVFTRIANIVNKRD